MDEQGRRTRDGRSYGFVLSTRRVRDLFNSTGVFLDSVRKRTPHNPAYLNPADMKALGVRPGDLVELVTSHGRAVVFAAEDDNLRPGVVSTTHGWGDLPETNQGPAEAGTCINLLIDDCRHVEAINAMPHFSGVPVDIVPLGR